MEMIQEQNVVPEKKVIREQNVKRALYAAMAVLHQDVCVLHHFHYYQHRLYRK